MFWQLHRSCSKAQKKGISTYFSHFIHFKMWQNQMNSARKFSIFSWIFSIISRYSSNSCISHLCRNFRRRQKKLPTQMRLCSSSFSSSSFKSSLLSAGSLTNLERAVKRHSRKCSRFHLRCRWSSTTLANNSSWGRWKWVNRKSSTNYSSTTEKVIIISKMKNKT